MLAFFIPSIYNFIIFKSQKKRDTLKKIKFQNLQVKQSIKIVDPSPEAEKNCFKLVTAFVV
jgi:hypothetical protein